MSNRIPACVGDHPCFFIFESLLDCNSFPYSCKSKYFDLCNAETIIPKSHSRVLLFKCDVKQV